MPNYAYKGATLMCTGCPGIPGKLDATEVRTVELGNDKQATEDDKTIEEPGFGTCLAIPTAPKKCSPKLGTWANTKSDVLIKGKKALLWPNTIPCTAGPGVITMVNPKGRPTVTNATGSGPGTIDCTWKPQGSCKKHQTDVGYPKSGIVERKSLRDWPHPNTMALKEYTTKINDTHTSKKLNGHKVSALNYSYQRHHVIPVEAFNGIPDLKHNLILLGYNINLYTENGISLPFRQQDMMWHDLQCHRGSHPAYTSTVQEEVQAITNECGLYCEKGEQSKLWDELEKTVSKYIRKIISWDLMIHPWAKTDKDNAATSGWI